jgi:hypothetical protein
MEVTTPNTPNQQDSFSDSDAQWFARLTGSDAPGDDAQAAAEADAMRRAFAVERERIEQDARLREPIDGNEHAAALQRLLFRLRRERLLETRASRWRRWVPAAGLAVAATLVFFAIGPLQRDDVRVYYDEPPTLRGAIRIVNKTDNRPRQAAEAFAAALRTAGIPASIYQSGMVFSVDANVPAERLADLAPMLAAHGIPGRPGPMRATWGPN